MTSVNTISASPEFGLNQVAVLAVIGLVFCLMYWNVVGRLAAMLMGAGMVILIGQYQGFFGGEKVFHSLVSRCDTLALLFGMNLISCHFEQTGFFDAQARKIARFTGGDKWTTIALFCLLTYVFSLFVNNLTTILVVVPITLRIAGRLGFDLVPVVVAEIIASNLGGASSMIGDFPNMLIGSDVGIPFNHFLLYMMPMCMILLAVLLLYLVVSEKQRPVETRAPAASVLNSESSSSAQAPLHVQDQTAVKRGLLILVLAILGFLLSDAIRVPPWAIALIAGAGTVAFASPKKWEVIEKVRYYDILFFAALFIMVGGVEATGILNLIAGGLENISGQSVVAEALLLMWFAAFVTCFMSAGPTTALFIPIVRGLQIAVPHHLLWWALSLGVCAGSSATLTGATAGPVAAGLVEDFSKGKATISFRDFAATGVPVMFIFLIASSIYVALLWRF